MTRHYRSDHRPPPFLVPEVRLVFDIQVPDWVVVRATLRVRRNPEAAREEDLVLPGGPIRLLGAWLDGLPAGPDRVEASPDFLRVRSVPDEFELVTEGGINPAANSELMGLYTSGPLLCTQNEPEGFRRITWHPDRPDVLGVYTVRIEAPRAAFPVLLCNGNPVASGDLPGDRHFAEWHDPFPKPSYLFALVAGSLDRLDGAFTTRSGRSVALRVYTDPGNTPRAQHAMQSLIRSMAWDEKAYGLEYDLDLFMIVAVDAFNFGAMENKGLNLFNSANVLAAPETATDADFDRIEAIVAHEYFHNWSGDRVTLRDWFQLTLKEGLTVFRDQQFSADHHSAAVERIRAVRDLRERQFAEDAGPNAHPIRPESYVEINNFYTSTVYEKGAEIIRMLHTLAGPEAYRRATDLYFRRHDGQAVTCEHFLRCVEEAAGLDLARFRRWYAQAGTPVVELIGRHDPAARRFFLEVRQSTPPTADGSPKEPLLMPMRLGLLGPGGADLPLRLAGETQAAGTSRVFVLREAAESFAFEDIATPPAISAFRGFSAPVRVRDRATDEQRLLRLRHDADPFNRYEAGQALALSALVDGARRHRAGERPEPPGRLIDAFADAGLDDRLDAAFRVELLAAPGLSAILQELDEADHAAAFAAREAWEHALASRHASAWQALVERFHPDPAARDDATCAARALRNRALQLLARLPGHAGLAAHAFQQAGNMTDRMAALGALCDFDLPGRAEALTDFHTQWRDNFLVMNKWFAVQVSARRGDALAIARALTGHSSFDPRNPNRLRAVYGVFAGNAPHFHREDGEGYRFLAGAMLEIDPVNSSVSAGLAKAFRDFARLPSPRRALMRAALGTVAGASGISAGLREIVENTLKGA